MAHPSSTGGGTARPTARLAPGLYIVATPIGNARDITLRALDTLAGADVLAAEDTRTLRRLMELHGLAVGDRPLVAYHDHNGPRARPKLLAALAAGQSVAYVSEAGTPLIADPGYQLVREAVEAGARVEPIPGVSAAITGLSAAGLPSDQFHFCGFPPTGQSARRAFLQDLATVPGTLILYEAPRRVADTLAEAAAQLGPDRPAVLARELTKRFEEFRRGTLASLTQDVGDMVSKGELVLMIGPGSRAEVTRDQIATALGNLLETNRLKDAASQVAEALGVPRRDVYQIGLSLKQEHADAQQPPLPGQAE